MASLRAETVGLVRLARADLDRIWREVASGAPAPEILNDVLPALVTEYGAMGASVAADWYDDMRDQAEAPKAFRAEPLEPSDRGARSLIGWALTTATDDAGLAGLILGGTQRRIADHVRLTVTSSSVADPSAQGWRRVGDGHTCEWCARLLDGEIHYVEGYDFPAHDSCGCGVEPVWD